MSVPGLDFMLFSMDNVSLPTDISDFLNSRSYLHTCNIGFIRWRVYC